MQPLDPAAPRAKKSLGQNFLQDGNIARKIVDALNIGSDDFVVEIGPGPGALSSIIAGKGPRKLLLIEKDEHWAQDRRETVVTAGRQPEVLCADALTVAWEEFPAPWKCIGNLPYNVASPLMWEIFSRARGLERAVFMIQKEVGQRLTAGPDTSAYGALSVWVQSFVVPKAEFYVPPQVFHPRPKVDSAVLSFAPLGPGGGDFSPPALAAALKACFQMRRKQLGTIVRAAGKSSGVLEELGIDPRLRPENLSVATFHRLAGAGVFPVRRDGQV